MTVTTNYHTEDKCQESGMITYSRLTNITTIIRETNANLARLLKIFPKLPMYSVNGNRILESKDEVAIVHSLT